jgi:diacylglycerol kinase (ATP)
VPGGDDEERRARIRAEIEAALASVALPFTFAPVDRPPDASGAVREALARGDRFLVAVGGDDLVHHVANGLVPQGRPVHPEAVLGVVPVGALNDFARTFGLPEDPGRAARHLAGDGLFPIDSAVVTYTGRRGSEATRTFVNVAQAGLGGATLARAARLPSGLGRSRRLLAFWSSLAASRPTRVLLTGDRRSWEGKVHNLVIANCQYNGDGVKISPRSWPGDGYLDVLVMAGPRSDAFTILPRAYRGEHLPHHNIVEYRCKRLVIEADRELPIEADGQVLGTTPATFEVVPQSLRLKI